MVIYGERFDYNNYTLTEQQERVARCRAEAARKGRQRARRWAQRRKQGDGHPARARAHQLAESPRYEYGHSDGQAFCEPYYLGDRYTGHYFGGESLVVQYVVGELHNGQVTAAHFIAGHFEQGDTQGLFLVMEQAGPAD